MCSRRETNARLKTGNLMAEGEKQEWIGNAFIGIGLGAWFLWGAGRSIATLGALACAGVGDRHRDGQ